MYTYMWIYDRTYCFCAGMQSPEVKQTDIKTVADVYSAIIVKVFNALFKHHAEKDAE